MREFLSQSVSIGGSAYIAFPQMRFRAGGVQACAADVNIWEPFRPVSGPRAKVAARESAGLVEIMTPTLCSQIYGIPYIGGRGRDCRGEGRHPERVPLDHADDAGR